jgi:hypothetical protein
MRFAGAQRGSGQTQAAYCRTHGLDPKYFTRWKGKLRPNGKSRCNIDCRDRRLRMNHTTGHVTEHYSATEIEPLI